MIVRKPFARSIIVNGRRFKPVRAEQIRAQKRVEEYNAVLREIVRDIPAILKRLRGS